MLNPNDLGHQKRKKTKVGIQNNILNEKIRIKFA